MVGINNRDPLTGRNIARDLTGLRTGTITIIRKGEGKDKFGYQMWVAKCDCGVEFERGSFRFVRTENRKSAMTCPDCATYGRPYIPDQGSHLNSVYGTYRYGAKSRELDFNLTKDQFKALIKKNCFYCDSPPVARYTSPNLVGVYECNGVDRIDSSLGYSIENCVPCCTTCNRAKMDHSLEDFMDWIKRLYLHQQKIQREQKRQPAPDHAHYSADRS